MDQSAKLEQFLLLAKNARGKSAAEVINRATEEPGIYGFGELLDIVGIKEVKPLRAVLTYYFILNALYHQICQSRPCMQTTATVQPHWIKCLVSLEVLWNAAERHRTGAGHPTTGALLLWDMDRLQGYVALARLPRIRLCSRHIFRLTPDLTRDSLEIAGVNSQLSLSRQQQLKLKQLTVVSLAAQSKVGHVSTLELMDSTPCTLLVILPESL